MQKLRKYTKKILFSLLALELVVSYRVLTYKDPYLMKFHDGFMEIVKQYCTPSQYNLPYFESVRFYNADSVGEIARCERSPKRFAIKVDKGYWASMNDDERTQVIAHELMHCLFGDEHSTDKNHFMYPYMPQIEAGVFYSQVDDYLKAKCGERDEL